MPGVPNSMSLALDLFFRPLSLHERLSACGIEDPGGTFGGLWGQGEEGRDDARRLCRRLLLVITMVPVLMLVAGVALGVAGVPILGGWLWGMLFCIAGGLFIGLHSGAAAGALMVMTGAPFILSVHTVTAGAIAPRGAPAIPVIIGISSGIALGLFMPGTMAIRYGSLPSFTRMQVMTIVTSLIPAALFGMTGDLRHGVAVSLGAILATLVFALRVPFYPLEALWQFAAWFTQRVTHRCTLNWSPIHFHEFSTWEYPLLRRHIRESIEQWPVEAQSAVHASLKSRTHRKLLGLFADVAFPELADRIPPKDPRSGRFACACCGHATIASLEAADACPVCGWRPDSVDDLVSARRHFLRTGSCSPELQHQTRVATADETRLRLFRLVGETVEEREPEQ